MQEGLRVVRYLKGTRDFGLQLDGDDAPLVGFVVPPAVGAPVPPLPTVTVIPVELSILYPFL